MTKEYCEQEIKMIYSQQPLEKRADPKYPFSFYFEEIQNKRPHLLSFRFKGDKWQQVHCWLMEPQRQAQIELEYMRKS
jgi:hypothetical protein